MVLFIHFMNMLYAGFTGKYDIYHITDIKTSWLDQLHPTIHVVEIQFDGHDI